MIELRSGDAEAIISEEGAYLYALRYRGRDVILPGDLSRKTRGGMALLIPYANRVKGGRYEFEGQIYQLPVNEEGNAIHGLVLDEAWRVTDKGAGGVSLELVLSHKGYPSTLKCNVAYALAPTSLSLEMVARNVGGAKAPLIVGAHPYFIVEGSWLIRAEGALRCLAEGKIPTGILVPHEFGEDGEYDDCFLIEQDPLVLESKRFRITVIRRGMPYVQIYTGVRRAVAVEPMSGAPDAYHNGMGLRVLSPDEEARFGFTIKFE